MHQSCTAPWKERSFQLSFCTFRAPKRVFGGFSVTYYQNNHVLRDGAILVYTRAGRKKTTWQTRLKVPGVTGYLFKSLKTADLNTAITEAEDLFYSFKAEQRLGLDVKQAGNLKFKDLWKRFYAAHESGLSVHRQRLHSRVILRKRSVTASDRP